MKLKALRLHAASRPGPTKAHTAEAPAPLPHGLLTLGLGQTPGSEQLEHPALQFGLKFGTPPAHLQQPLQLAGSHPALRWDRTQSPPHAGDGGDLSPQRVLQRPLECTLIDRSGQIHQGPRWRGQGQSTLRVPLHPWQPGRLVSANPSPLSPQPLRCGQLHVLRPRSVERPPPASGQHPRARYHPTPNPPHPHPAGLPPPTPPPPPPPPPDPPPLTTPAALLGGG